MGYLLRLLCGTALTALVVFALRELFTLLDWSPIAIVIGIALLAGAIALSIRLRRKSTD